YLHPAGPVVARGRRDPEAQPAAAFDKGQAADRGRRLHRPRHDHQAHHRAPARRRGERDPHAHLEPAHALPVLHGCGHRLDQGAHSFWPHSRRSAGEDRRRLAALPVHPRTDQRHRPRHRPGVLPRVLRRFVSRAGAAAAGDGQDAVREPDATTGEGVSQEGLSYAAAGVDVEAYERVLERVKPLIAATHGKEVAEGVGPFAGLYALPGGAYLAASTDGVGTKIKVAIATGNHRVIGADIVHHCVNDIATAGARPLFFLDYFATGNLDPEVFSQLIDGMSQACREAGCALLGGETAEMPGVYALGDYDLAGFIVGLVEADVRRD